VFSAPALSETRTEGGYRTCSIARSTCEDYRDMFDYPAEGTPFGGARRPALPADPVPPVEHHAPEVRGAQTALQARTAAGAKHPWLNSAGAASFAGRTSLLQEVVCGKVAARGRAASPTKRGRIVRSDKDLSPMMFSKGYKSGVPTLYPVVTIEDYRTPRVR
jgi:hypothetical protein